MGADGFSNWFASQDRANGVDETLAGGFFFDAGGDAYLLEPGDFGWRN